MASNSNSNVSGPYKWVLDSLDSEVRNNPDMALAVAVYRALNEVVKKSKEGTSHGLIEELKKCTTYLIKASSNISLKSIAQIYMYFITGTSNLYRVSFDELKSELISRGRQLEMRTNAARDQIALNASTFLRDGMVIMTHGFSRVVLAVLKYANSTGRMITVIQTESSPQYNGIQMAKKLAEDHIPVQLITDSAAAYMMDQVDMVLVGAEAVVESGGVINNMGTFQIALVAKSLKKPFYVAAETFKMTHDFPLNQQGIPNQSFAPLPAATSLPSDTSSPFPISSSQHPDPLEITNDHLHDSLEWHCPKLDYTPPQYITLLFTDLSVLTPSAVCDELIKFDQVLPVTNTL